jgi:hypothetical protein
VRKIRRPGWAVTLCAVVAVVTGGCSGGGHPAASQPAAGPSNGGSSPSVPTGAELAKLLPPQASLPPGWQEPQPDVHDAANSGSAIKPPIPAFGPIPPLYYECGNWNLQLNPDELSFLWRSSDADALVSPPSLPAPSRFVSLALSAYQPGNASKQLAWDVAFAKRCHSYRFKDHSPVTVTATPVAGPGDQNLYVQLVNPTTYQGQFLRIHIGVLLARVGNVIIGVEQTGSENIRGNPVMPFTGFTSIASWLARSVRSLTGSG